MKAQVLYLLQKELITKDVELFKSRKALRLIKRITTIFDYFKNHEELWGKSEVIHFEQALKSETLTEKVLMDAEDLIEQHKVGNVKPKRNGKHQYSITEEDVKSFCLHDAQEIEVQIKILNQAKSDFQQLLKKAEQGEDILKKEYASYYETLYLQRLEGTEKELIFSLFEQWFLETNLEYASLKRKLEEKQDVGSLVSIKEIKSENYPMIQSLAFLEDDVKETATYVRSLLKSGQISLAISLVGENSLSIFTRIVYEIEIEKKFLKQEMEVSSDEDKQMIFMMLEELEGEKGQMSELICSLQQGGKAWVK